MLSSASSSDCFVAAKAPDIQRCQCQERQVQCKTFMQTQSKKTQMCLCCPINRIFSLLETFLHNCNQKACMLCAQNGVLCWSRLQSVFLLCQWQVLAQTRVGVGPQNNNSHNNTCPKTFGIQVNTKFLNHFIDKCKKVKLLVTDLLCVWPNHHANQTHIVL